LTDFLSVITDEKNISSVKFIDDTFTDGFLTVNNL